MLSMSKIKYSLSQAKKNVLRNGLMSVASLFTITCCLLILGLFTIFSLNINAFTDQVKDQCEVQLYMNNGLSDERTRKIGDEILALENVKEIELYTREQMFDYAMNDVFEGKEDLMGEYSQEDNPFSDSYKITLKDISITQDTLEELKKIEDVSHIENKQDVTNLVVSFSKVVKKASIIVMIILLIVSVVIISNTVRLTVFNRRKEINIMKYIGATDRFIRTPFIIEGVMIGILGAILSFGIISWAYIVFYNRFLKSSFNIVKLVKYSSLAPDLAIIFIVIGCIIGVIGSSISMRKYLKV